MVTKFCLFCFKQFITLAIGLVFILNIDLINGENKFRKSYESKAKTKSTLSKQYIIPNEGLGEDLAESRAQFSVVNAGHDLSEAAGGHGYFQYARVPHKKAWEFGKSGINFVLSIQLTKIITISHLKDQNCFHLIRVIFSFGFIYR